MLVIMQLPFRVLASYALLPLLASATGNFSIPYLSVVDRSHTLRSDSVLKELLLQRRACLFGQLDRAASPSGIYGHHGARPCHGDAEAP